MSQEFEKKTKINVRSNMKAMLKMQVAAEKAKKTLSPHGVSEANVSVECLADDRDLSYIVTKDEFEAKALPLLNKLAGPIEKCLAEANLTRQQISEVEIVGGSSRINSVKKTIGSIMSLDASLVNYGLKTTMNSDEAVARGAALQCAMLSSRVKVKPFHVLDRLPYDITISYESSSTSAPVSEGKDQDEDEKETTEEVAHSSNGSDVLLFASGEATPRGPKLISFLNKTNTFTVTAQYSSSSTTQLPQGEALTIATFTIKIPQEYVGKSNKVRLTFAIDKNLCLNLSSAILLEPITAGDAKETKEGEEEKKRYKKVDLAVEFSSFGLSRDKIKAAIAQESFMQAEDDLIVETANKRNELESYIYSMRDKLDGGLKNFCTNSEKQQLQQLLTGAENWLENDGYDGTKLMYVRKLDELRAIGGKIESRQYEENNRSQACDGLRRQAELCKNFANLKDDDHAHISDDERSKVKSEAESAENWLFDELAKQADIQSYNDPILTVDGISKKRQALYNACNPIMSKPKPKPKPQEKKEENKNESKSESKGTESTPMDQDKPESSSNESKESSSQSMDQE